MPSLPNAGYQSFQRAVSERNDQRGAILITAYKASPPPRGRLVIIQFPQMKRAEIELPPGLEANSEITAYAIQDRMNNSCKGKNDECNQGS